MIPPISSCHEVDRSVLERVFAPPRYASEAPVRERVLALVGRMTELAESNRDVETLLGVLARMARSSWLDGQLAVAVDAHAEGSELDLLVYDGLSYERMVRPMPVRVTLDVWVASIVPKVEELAPLRLVFHEPGQGIQLVADALGAATSPPPPSVHRRETTAVSTVRIPSEALRPEEAARIPTAKVPRVTPGSYSQRNSDPGDEGWE